jgi:3-deoxy-D-arabino-heptulosonate 7-phosphate (DAHP) synthase
MALSLPPMSQTFLGITEDGRASAVTNGRKSRLPTHSSGGTNGPNYEKKVRSAAEDALRSANAPVSIMVTVVMPTVEKILPVNQLYLIMC